jgi:integrase
MNDEEILNDLKTSRNLSKGSIEKYKTVIKNYTNFNQKSFQEMIDEAEEEEEQGIRWKKRKLRIRLLKYREYLIKNYSKNTIRRYSTMIQSIYSQHEIELHNLPRISEKNMHEFPPLSFEDLPDKEIIKLAIKIADPLMRAIILFMSSSGCARKETLNMTIQDFINATKEYHYQNNIYAVINELKNKEYIVPMFKIKRRKTAKYYFTFCTPEATTEIINYLKTINRELKNHDKLFKIHIDYFTVRL